MLRWDNKEEFPHLSTYPHHHHDEDGHVTESPLTGTPERDIMLALQVITGYMRGKQSSAFLPFLRRLAIFARKDRMKEVIRMKEFSKWTIDDVEKTFQLTPNKPHPELQCWMERSIECSAVEQEQLQRLCDKLNAHIYDWNEEELKINFIGQLLTLVDYDRPNYQAFFERTLTANMQNQRLSGVVDCMIAAGRRVPESPIFCLHEYKPEKHASNDPLGQVLVAMVAAQLFNQDEKPMYGAYVVGRFWYFLALTPPNYGVSLAFDATKLPELLDIFKLLKSIKQIIERDVKL